MKRHLLALCATLLAGCGTTGPCDERTDTMEVHVGDAFEETERGLISYRESLGWDCSLDRTYTDAEGMTVEVHSCTICD